MASTIEHVYPPAARRPRSWLRGALYALGAAGSLLLVCLLAFLFFTGPILNTLVKPMILRACARAYPAYSFRIGDMTYSPIKNRWTADSVSVSAGDGTGTGSLERVSVSGINWVSLLWGGDLGSGDVANAEPAAWNVALTFPRSHYELRCGRLHLSVADSEMVLDALTVVPSGDDEQFFAEVRQTNQATPFHTAGESHGPGMLRDVEREHPSGACYRTSRTFSWMSS